MKELRQGDTWPSLPPPAGRQARSQSEVSWAVTCPQRREVPGWDCQDSPAWSQKGEGLVAWEGLGVHTHTHTAAGGVTGWAFGVHVGQTKRKGHTSRPHQPWEGPTVGAPAAPPAHTWPAVFGNKRLFQKQEKEEGEAPSTERRERCQASWCWNYVQTICQFALSLPGYF